MKKSSFLVIFVFLMLSLCSCAKQRYVNHYEFTQRFNKLSSEISIDDNSFFNKESEFNYYIEAENLRSILLTLTENERQRVTQIELTAIKNDKELNEDEQQMLFDLFSSILSVILNCDEHAVNQELKNIDINKDLLSFNSFYEDYNILKSNINFCFNDEIISIKINIK